MGVETTAGTTIRVSAAAPATFNQAGYAALAWTKVGEVTDLGTFGRKYNLVTHQPIDTRGTKKLKGSFNDGAVNLTYGIDDDDSGQVIVEAAVDDDDPISVEITSQSGTIYYFQALIMSAERAFGGVDNVLSSTPAFEITTADDGTGVVKVV